MSTTRDLLPDTRRVGGLAAANTRLLVRNRLTLTYALLLPLLPLGLLLITAEDPTAGTSTIGTALLLAYLFPVFYNLLSVVVTRRDELVLKRLRTGEARDVELVLAMSLPGVVVAVVLAVLVVPVAVALGMPLPQDPLLYAVMVLLACVMFVAFALWTAAWTASAEAAQLTSAPVLLLATAGAFVMMLPGPLAEVLSRTPGGALDSLVRLSWLGAGTGSTWGEAAQPLLVLLAWTVLALALARRSMRWEPRT
ncbi:ABC transporter permease [Jannaschia sp. R86511]|uniref:ABC transporter permease n=1 Tax=Jannaschia sp. R86511 TaxID=3093853 RepID=UPI0036D4229D